MGRTNEEITASLVGTSKTHSITKTTSIVEIKKSSNGKTLEDVLRLEMEVEGITMEEAIEQFKEWVAWKGVESGFIGRIEESYAGENDDWRDDIPVVMSVGWR